MIDKNMELNFGYHEFTYFCDFCELKKTKKSLFQYFLNALNRTYIKIMLNL